MEHGSGGCVWDCKQAGAPAWLTTTGGGLGGRPLNSLYEFIGMAPHFEAISNVRGADGRSITTAPVQ
jgi:hypothetical protein